MDEKVIESREYLMNLYKGVYTANSGVGRQALARIDDTLANLRIRNNNLQEQLDLYKEVIEEVREYINSNPNVFYDEYLIDVETLKENEGTYEMVGEIKFISTLLQILDKAKEVE